MNPIVINGTIEFKDPFSASDGAVARVLVEDVSRADAAATVVARLDIPLDEAFEQGAVMTFSVSVAQVYPALRYAVRVHIDHAGSGRVKKGDLISPISNPVLTHGAGTQVKIGVVKV